MEQLITRFNRITKNNPSLSSFVCFNRAVAGQNYDKRIIRKAFDKLVKRKDCSKTDKEDLLHHIYKIAKEQ